MPLAATGGRRRQTPLRELSTPGQTRVAHGAALQRRAVRARAAMHVNEGAMHRFKETPRQVDALLW